MLKERELCDRYNEQVNDFVQRGVLRKLSQAEIEEWTGPVRYVDHHPVIKVNSTTPVRLVVNSSFARAGEESLNSIMMKGPNILNCLFDILVRWRMFPFAFVGDIAKMYHNVSTGELGHLRRLLWREYESNRSPDIYVFQRVTFGDRPAGCIVMSALRMTAEMFGSIGPEAADMITRDSYMDDVVSGANTQEKADTAIENMQEIAGKGSFTFKKYTRSWVKDDNNRIDNVLGIRWRIFDDKLSANMKGLEFFVGDEVNWTRRTCWKFTNSLYDPLGFCVPVTVRLKILMKDMFVTSERYRSWDAQLVQDDQNEWIKIAADVVKLKDVWVHRSCFSNQDANKDECCLVGFCDASQGALCAVVYCKFGGRVSFLAAKSSHTNQA